MHLLSDFCNRISQAAKIKIKNALIKNCKIVVLCLFIIYRLGYINYFKIINFKYVLVNIKYFLSNSVIRAIFSLSKPSLKNYLTYKKIQSFTFNSKWGLNGFFIFSTGSGLFLDIECLLKKSGGKAICAVY